MRFRAVGVGIHPLAVGAGAAGHHQVGGQILGAVLEAVGPLHAGAAAAALEADDALHRRQVPEAPQPEGVLQVDQLLAELVERPVRSRMRAEPAEAPRGASTALSERFKWIQTTPRTSFRFQIIRV